MYACRRECRLCRRSPSRSSPAHSAEKHHGREAPGFSADCLETLEELGIRGRDTFLHAGGEQFALLDCLNDSRESIAMLERLVLRELAGWLPAA